MDFRWLIICPQLPATPSRPRVMIWRRLHTIGSLGFVNGLWLLPYSPQAEKHAQELQANVESQGGASKVFLANSLNDSTQQSILESMHKECIDEYQELQEECNNFLTELEKETQSHNFSYAEYEENEQDLKKLEHWFVEIQKRDFFETDSTAKFKQLLMRCHEVLQTFANAIYYNESKNKAGKFNLSSSSQGRSENNKKIRRKHEYNQETE